MFIFIFFCFALLVNLAISNSTVNAINNKHSNFLKQRLAAFHLYVFFSCQLQHILIQYLSVCICFHSNTISISDKAGTCFGHELLWSSIRIQFSFFIVQIRLFCHYFFRLDAVSYSRTIFTVFAF